MESTERTHAVPDSRNSRQHVDHRDCQLFQAGDPFIESLESRLLLAGSVKLTVKSNGDLLLRGDGRDNHVEVSAVGDTLKITGQPDRNGEATTIKFNGETLSEATLDAPGGMLQGKLTVNLGGGNDFLRLKNVTFQNQVKFNGGGGGDSLAAFDSTFDELLSVRGGGGNEAVVLNNSSFHGSIDVKSGGGADWIAMTGVTADGDQIKIVTGGSTDKVSFETSTIHSDVEISTGGLPDELYLGGGTVFDGAVNANLGSFADNLMVENGVTFNDLGNARINGNNRGPNYENLFIYENGVDMATLPDLSSFKLPYETDPGQTVYEHFEYRLTTIDHDIPFLDLLKTTLYVRGFEFSEMPIDTSVISGTEMDALIALVEPGLRSNVTGERFMYKLIFAPDLA